MLYVKQQNGNSPATPPLKNTVVYPGTYTYVWSDLTPAHMDDMPVNRSKHAACLHHRVLYIHGGKDGNIPQKDLWKYDLGTDTWERVLTKGDRPPFLQEHTLVGHKTKLYAFGGAFSSSNETPLWTLDLDSLMWKKYLVDSEVLTPGGRRGHSAVLFNNAMHIYGGFMDLKGSTGEMWSFDLETESWHLQRNATSNSDGPGARHGHTAVVHDGNMWVYGGMADLQPKADLWCWSFGLLSWNRIRAKAGPPDLTGHIACRIPDGMLVFGGEHKGELQADLWKFKFSCQTWQKIQLHQRELPSARVHHAAVVVPHFLLTSAKQDTATQRTQSEPRLKPSQLDITQRPYSSPPAAEVADRDRLSHAFKNRVSPSANKAFFEKDEHNVGDCGIGYSNVGFVHSVSTEENVDKSHRKEISCDSISTTQDIYELGTTQKDYMNYEQDATDRNSEEAVAHFPSSSSTGTFGLDTVPLLRSCSQKSQTYSHSLPSLPGVYNPNFIPDTKGQFVRVNSREMLEKDDMAPLGLKDFEGNGLSILKAGNRRRSRSLDMLSETGGTGSCDDDDLDIPQEKKSKLDNFSSYRQPDRLKSISMEDCLEQRDFSKCFQPERQFSDDFVLDTSAWSPDGQAIPLQPLTNRQFSDDFELQDLSINKLPSNSKPQHDLDRLEIPGAVDTENYNTGLGGQVKVHDTIIGSPRKSTSPSSVNANSRLNRDLEYATCSGALVDFTSCASYPDKVRQKSPAEQHQMLVIMDHNHDNVHNTHQRDQPSSVRWEKNKGSVIISGTNGSSRNQAASREQSAIKSDFKGDSFPADIFVNKSSDRGNGRCMYQSHRPEAIELSPMRKGAGPAANSSNRESESYHQPENLYLFILGGREDGPPNLCRKPFSMWKCQISIGNIKR